MTILTIIVTYNAMKWIDRCIGSLQQSTIPTDIFIVDNGSTDGTIDYIQHHFPEVRLSVQKQNLGFGQANNIGLRLAISEQYDYVLLLNQDAWIASDMLQQLLDAADGQSLLSPVHLNGQGTALDRNFQRNAVERGGYRYLLQKDAMLRTPTGIHPTDEINAACWFLPVSVVQKIGGFNPLFFHYHEDNNYLYRLHYHNYNIAFITGTHVWHDREQRPKKKISQQHIYQNLVLIASDIRYMPIRIFFRRLRYFAGLMHTMLRERDFRILPLYMHALASYYKQSRAIRMSRAKERLLQPNWL